MSLNVELFTNNVIFPPSHACSDLKFDSHIISEPKLIVTEIIDDILNTALKLSESPSTTSNLTLTETNLNLKGSETNANKDIIDLTRNYKEEFRNILQNLKCHTLSHSTPNSSLEEQITNVIDDIKSLEAAIRIKDYIEQKCLVYSDNREETMSQNNNIGYRTGVIDIHNESNLKAPVPQEFILDHPNDEIILQVIDLQQCDGNSAFSQSSFTSFNLNDTILNNIDERPRAFYEIGDQQQEIIPEEEEEEEQQQQEEEMISTPLDAGETDIKLPAPNPEPENDDNKAEDCVKVQKKQSVGRRIWSFFKKSSKLKAKNMEEKT